MSIKEIDTLFSKGLESMRRGNFQEAENLFVKAKTMTLELSKK
jgi:hypothetical protein